MRTRPQPPVTYSAEEIAAQLAALGIAESPQYLDMPWMGPINYSWSAERALALYRERYPVEPNVCHFKPSFWLLGRSEGGGAAT